MSDSTVYPCNPLHNRCEYRSNVCKKAGGEIYACMGQSDPFVRLFSMTQTDTGTLFQQIDDKNYTSDRWCFTDEVGVQRCWTRVPDPTFGFRSGLYYSDYPNGPALGITIDNDGSCSVAYGDDVPKDKHLEVNCQVADDVVTLHAEFPETGESRTTEFQFLP